MRTKIVTLVLLALLLHPLAAGAAGGGPKQVSRFTLDSGGHSLHSSGGRFQGYATIGQPEATVIYTGQRFADTGGYWGPISYKIMLPVVVSQ